MNLRALFALVPLLLVAALLPPPAAADNTVTNSIGTVQAGGVAAAPAAAGELLNGAVEAVATAPVAVGSNGGDNAASSSIGSVQIGGDNSADRSLLTAQASDLRSRPAAAARAAGLRARVALPVATGNGRNDARRSAVTVQLGGGQSDGSAGRVQANRSAAGPSAAVSRGGLSAARVLPRLVDRPGSSPGRGVAVRDSTLAADADVDLGSLHARVNRVAVEPRLALDVRPLAGAALGGRIGVDPPAGSAERSFGTVQAGGVTVAPTLVLWTPLGTVGLGGETLGIAGGGSRATDSIGTAQVGGGNEASDSLGTAQVSGISVGPRLTLDDSPIGDAVVTAPVAIGGPGGNRAEGSIGTVQLGGGNTVRNSILSLQVGSGSTGSNPPTCCIDGGGIPGGGTSDGIPGNGTAAGGTPAGGTTGGTRSGGGGGNGSSTSGAATGSTGSGVPVPAGAQGGLSSDGVAPDGEEPSSGGVLPASDSTRRTAGGLADGELPFTGVPLWLLAFIGLFLIAGGMAVRGAGK